MKNQVKSVKSVKPVLFHQVALKSVIFIEGKKYIKFSPRKVMSDDGKILTIADATYVIAAA